MRGKQQGMTVVFSTYQSIEVVSKAQHKLLEETDDEYGKFDLIICDEAHRTTGVTLKDENESAFVKVHDNDFLKADKRIYMTATPRLYTDAMKDKAKQSDAVLCSMDDKSMYGDEIYRIGFGEAVDKKLLTDYKVLILAVGDKDITPALRNVLTSEDGTIETDDAAKFVGCINALSKRVLGDEGLVKDADPLPMRRAVAFCQNIKKSKETAEIFSSCKESYMADVPEDEKLQLVDVAARHVDGTMSATARDAALMWLKEQPENERECRMLTNARCLSEGVDVPSLDAVVFVSAKNSQVDVVQSVGRVMRRSEGKQYGYIIIPVVVPADVEGDKVLENHPNFKVVWTVLNALRAHDDRFNAEVNKIELSKKKPKNIVFGGVGGSGDDNSTGDGTPKKSAVQVMAEQLALSFDELQNVFYAKLVTKVGTKRYWEQWARDIAQIAEQHIERIRQLISDNDRHRKAFQQLMRGLRRNINPNLSEHDAIEMLSQHIITRPVFEALFENYEFAKNNPVSKSMQQMLNLLDDEAKTEEEHEKLQKFYDYVRTTVGNIEDAAGRQRIIVELYDKFFKTASPKTVEKLGIVYTPVEVVDFIIRSVGFIIQKEFGRTLSDENVHILDPFTGTGTFITRLLQSGLIGRDALERKYRSEIHANEIVLMAYYIASINIENVYHDLMGANAEYRSFDGICLTDTFQLGEEASEENLYSEQFPINSKRVIEQKKKRITVIVGNPPYSIGQKSANDNAQNQTYKTLESRIENTYVAQSTAALNKSAYDSYIKAFRWASDRIDDKDGGVIGFVTNGAWLDANGLDGMRKCLEKEFSSVYVFNLRGNQRTSGELSRKEGGKIFGSGSRTPIAITILVKRPKEANQKARIFYRDIGDYLSREDKLRIIRNLTDISNPAMLWSAIVPNEHGDWLNKRSELFKLYTPLEPEKKFNQKSKTVFNTFAIGLASNRDTWVYNFSKQAVGKNMSAMINFYNRQQHAYQQAIKQNPDLSVEDFIDTDPTKISWTRSLRNSIRKKQDYVFSDEKLRIGIYRPFQKQYLYFASEFNEAIGLSPKLFPTPKHENLVICVSGVGASKDFSVLITDLIPCLDMVEKSQCFPLYWYDDSTADITDLFSSPQNEADRYVRRDGVTDWILSTARKQYGSKVGKEDIFYYVYGILHSPEYRTAFASDLKKSLPRLPLVDSADDFWAFSKAGRALAELHLNYETVEPYKGCLLVYGANTNWGDGMNYRVEKMRFGKLDSKTPDKTKIHYNQHITVEGIPLEAYDYVVNGKSAIEWIMERYAVAVNKDSGIRNDPNDWAAEHNDEKYILNLLLRIITVSLETMKIVYTLPKLKFEE
nr:type ISP restriction/modification enzyme [uncultured Alistipes sp.]